MKFYVTQSYIFSILIGAILLTGCAKQQRNTDKLKFEDYEKNISRAFEKKDREDAKVNLEKIVGYYPEHQKTPMHRLALADIYYEKGTKDFDNELLKIASQLYGKFCKFNPSNPKAEYASYQRIKSEFNQAGKIDQSSEALENTLNLCKKHLENILYKDGQFIQEVRNIQYTCEKLLIDKEIYIFNTSLRNDQNETAKSRLEWLKENYLPKHPDLAPRIKYLTCKLAIVLDDKQLAETTLSELIDAYKDSEYTKMAQNIYDKKINNKFFIF